MLIMEVRDGELGVGVQASFVAWRKRSMQRTAALLCPTKPGGNIALERIKCPVSVR